MHLYLYSAVIPCQYIMVTMGLKSGTPSCTAVNVLFTPSAAADAKGSCMQSYVHM